MCVCAHTRVAAHLLQSVFMAACISKVVTLERSRRVEKKSDLVDKSMAPGIHLRMKSSWKVLKATPLFLLLLSQSLASVPYENQPGASYSDSHSCVGMYILIFSMCS